MQSRRPTNPPHVLEVRRIGIDTYQEPVIYMRADCPICRSEGFAAQSRVRVGTPRGSIIATLNVVQGDLVGVGEIGLSEAAWRLLEAEPHELVTVSHPEPIESFAYVRAKLHGRELSDTELHEVVADIARGRYSDVQLAAFVAACSLERLLREELVSLTQAMVDVGERLEWTYPMVLDKHCVGGLPGNRTTPIVVAIVAASGLPIPKTSSRAITSPAGTADTMETLAPVELEIEAIRRVVEREGGCVVWGGAVDLSPADDVLIRVERALDLDSDAQLIASVLSKKLAAGATHVVVDVPVGPTAKVRTEHAARELSEQMSLVGARLGLEVVVEISDGREPVGRGIGPALEAQDVLSVLKQDPNAPHDLEERALTLAGRLLEIGRVAPAGQGVARATATLADGSAWRKFQAICEAQGGMRKPPSAHHVREILAERAGYVSNIDNRRLARVAKLAGAPNARASGVRMAVRLGDKVERGAPLFELHAETPGELAYSLEYLASQRDIIELETEAEANG